MNSTLQKQLKYLQYNHPVMAAKLASQGALQLNGLGELNLDLGDNLLGANPEALTLKTVFYDALDRGDNVTAAKAANDLTGVAGASAVTALFNLYRINKGKEPIALQSALGLDKNLGGLNFLPWAIGGALLIWAASAWMRKR
jgi:hypothetical protein